MGLRETKGNMYEFITHTWNPIKGECSHNCAYCYMKKDKQYLEEIRLDDREFKTDLGINNFIFVGSGTDLFAKDVHKLWINKTLDYCNEASKNLFGDKNKYLFQSKNPARFLEFIDHPVLANDSVLCTTLETNRWYGPFMGNAPKIEERVLAMEKIAELGIDTYITIEPMMNFDLDEFVELIRRCKPKQVSIGNNSRSDIMLPEPTIEKTEQLINELEKFTEVHRKKNLKE